MNRLRNSGLPFAPGIDSGLLHQDFDPDHPADPNYVNPDRDSTRYLHMAHNGTYSAGSFSFLYGANMAPYYYTGSPAGADGYYFVYTVTCDPRDGTGGRLPTRADVERLCDENRMRQIALTRSTGATTINTVAIDSPGSVIRTV